MRTMKVRFYGLSNDVSNEYSILVEGPFDGNLYWFELLLKQFHRYEIVEKPED
jgi:hypothetical protein